MVRVHLSPPPEREMGKHAQLIPTLLRRKTGCENEEHLVAEQPNGYSFIEHTGGFAKANTEKINNCIANSMFLFLGNKDEYERQREIFILVNVKLIWLMRKDV